MIEMLTTSIKYVIQCSKYSSNENELYRITTENDAYKHLDIETAKVINKQMKLNLTIDEDKEVINMCKAVEDMKESSRNEGIALGMAKGIEQGIEQGIVVGREDAMLEVIRNLMNKKQWSAKETMDILNIPQEEWDKYLCKLETIIA